MASPVVITMSVDTMALAKVWNCSIRWPKASIALPAKTGVAVGKDESRTGQRVDGNEQTRQVTCEEDEKCAENNRE